MTVGFRVPKLKRGALFSSTKVNKIFIDDNKDRVLFNLSDKLQKFLTSFNSMDALTDSLKRAGEATRILLAQIDGFRNWYPQNYDKKTFTKDLRHARKMAKSSGLTNAAYYALVPLYRQINIELLNKDLDEESKGMLLEKRKEIISLLGAKENTNYVLDRLREEENKTYYEQYRNVLSVVMDALYDVYALYFVKKEVLMAKPLLSNDVNDSMHIEKSTKLSKKEFEKAILSGDENIILDLNIEKTIKKQFVSPLLNCVKELNNNHKNPDISSSQRLQNCNLIATQVSYHILCGKAPNKEESEENNRTSKKAHTSFLKKVPSLSELSSKPFNTGKENDKTQTLIEIRNKIADYLSRKKNGDSKGSIFLDFIFRRIDPDRAKVAEELLDLFYDVGERENLFSSQHAEKITAKIEEINEKFSSAEEQRKNKKGFKILSIIIGTSTRLMNLVTETQELVDKVTPKMQ